MDRRSVSLQARLDDIRRRLRAMRTVTNTASSEISGGETIIDENGSLIFRDGGRLILGGSSIVGSNGNPLIDSQGNLAVDSLTVYGDILSAKDYLYQRESIEGTVVDTKTVSPIDITTPLEFPDWSSSAMITYYIDIVTRIRTPNTNKILVTINGKPVARPRSDEIGNVILSSSVVRGMTPEYPNIHVEVLIDDQVFPAASSRIKITVGGVFTV